MSGQPAAHPLERRDRIELLLKLSVAYCVLSLATLPFLGAIWLGELPVLVVPQLPKLWLAGWLRTEVVMPAIAALGLSAGSFSPDYALARPYALAAAYLIAVGAIVALAWARTRLARPYGRWAALLGLVAACDGLLTLVFAQRPGLTVY